MSLTPSSPPACGGTWTTTSGNSPPPVGSIPSYMGVLVSTSVKKSGSTISGDTMKIVVVKTNAGLLAEPGPQRHRDVRRDVLRLAGLTVRGRAPRRPPPATLPRVNRGLVLAALVLLAFPAGGAARTSASPLFEFGRIGGNVKPFRVQIHRDGTIDHTGPVRLAKPRTRLSQARLAALLRYARTQRFWSLPSRTFCRDSLPDFASFYVTINSGRKTHTVRVRGGCRPRLSRIYRALARATSVSS